MSDAVTIPRQWFEDLLAVCTEDRFKLQVLKAVFDYAADGTEDDTLIGEEKEMFVRMKKVIQNRNRKVRYYTKQKEKASESDAIKRQNRTSESDGIASESDAQTSESDASESDVFSENGQEKREKNQKRIENTPYELSEHLEKDKGGTGGKDTPPPKRKIFIPPKVEEVAEFCRQRNNNVDPESFVAFYSSKNWYIGSNRMVNWRMAVITWEKRNRQEANKNRPKRDYSGI